MKQSRILVEIVSLAAEWAAEEWEVVRARGAVFMAVIDNEECYIPETLELCYGFHILYGIQYSVELKSGLAR